MAKSFSYRWLLGQFENPDRTYRPVQIIHGYFPHDADGNGTAAFLHDAAEKGMGGFVVNVGGGVDTYLTDENEWMALKRFIESALDKGFKIWLYDEQGYPSGAAGRLLIDEHPEWQVMGLTCQNLRTAGSSGNMELYDGKVLYAAAYPITSVSAEGEYTLNRSGARPVSIHGKKLYWDLPEGDWLAAVLLSRVVDYQTMHHVPYVDLLRRETTEAFIAHTHQRYLDHLGAETFSRLEAIFTDEPGLAVHGCSGHFAEQYAVAAWTADFERMTAPEELISVFYDTGEEGASFRRRYWEMVARRYEEAYFMPIYAFCERNGIAATGHMYGEENLAMQIGLNGDLFGLMRWMQMPGVDRLYCTAPVNVIPEKTASSAAHLTGHECAMSESSSHFESNWWRRDYNVGDMINSSLYQAVLGVNRTASYYGYQQSPAERRLFEETVGRAAAFTTHGVHRASLLVLIPMEAAWERYLARDRKYWDSVLTWDVEYGANEAVRALDGLYHSTLKMLLDNQIDFDLVDLRGLDECTVRDGKIHLGREQFDGLVVFTASGEPEAVRRLRTYGAAVYSEDVPLDEIPRDLAIEGWEPDVYFRHNSLDNLEIYLLHNRSDKEKTLSVSLAVNGKTELFYPLEKIILPAETLHAVRVPAKGSVIIVVQT